MIHILAVPLPIQLSANVSWENMEDSPSRWVSASNTGDPDEAPGSGLAQLWQLHYLGNEPVSGKCLSVSLPFK